CLIEREADASLFCDADKAVTQARRRLPEIPLYLIALSVEAFHIRALDGREPFPPEPSQLRNETRSRGAFDEETRRLVCGISHVDVLDDLAFRFVCAAFFGRSSRAWRTSSSSSHLSGRSSPTCLYRYAFMPFFRALMSNPLIWSKAMLSQSHRVQSPSLQRTCSWSLSVSDIPPKPSDLPMA